MKKRIIFFSVYLLLSVASFAKNLDELVNVIKQNGYQNEYGEFEKESLDVEEKKIKRTNRDGASLSVDSRYTDYSNDDDEDASKTSAEVKYDFLIFDASYDHLDGDSSVAVGLEKDMKDLIYSKKSHNTEVFQYEKQQRLNGISENVDNEIIDFIELYKEYKDVELEIEFQKSLIPTLEAELEILKKKFDLGTGTELDYRYALMTLENQKSDIANLESELKKINQSFYLKYRLDVKEGELDDFDGSTELQLEDFEYIGERDSENLVLDEKISSENLDYSRYDSRIPNIDVGTKYELEDEYWTVYLSFSKNLFEYGDTSKLEEINLKELEVKKEELQKSNENERASYWNEYKTLSKEFQNLERELSVKELEYRIDKKKYEMGVKEFTDYRDTYDDYRQLKVNYLKKKNELYAFVEKIKYRR